MAIMITADAFIKHHRAIYSHTALYLLTRAPSRTQITSTLVLKSGTMQLKITNATESVTSLIANDKKLKFLSQRYINTPSSFTAKLGQS